MKVVILAGGMGTRIREERKPKPLVEIGQKPLLWHVMQIYKKCNFNEFIICLGYKSSLIKEYFIKSYKKILKTNIQIFKNKIIITEGKSPYLSITLVDTGVKTKTGGRLRKIRNLLEDESFLLCYADDLKNVNMNKLVKFHRKQKSIVTLTGMNYSERFGILKIRQNKVVDIIEKPKNTNWINGGYYVMEPEVFHFIKNDNVSFETESLKILTRKNKVSIFKYTGEYVPLDTLNDKIRLEKLWNSKQAYWKTW